MKYAKKRDANEPQIVAAFLAAGCSVQRLDAAGVPDLLVGHKGRNLLVEVKVTGRGQNHRRATGGRGDLTADQVAWFDAWRGAPVVVVRTEADVIALLALRESEAA